MVPVDDTFTFKTSWCLSRTPKLGADWGHVGWSLHVQMSSIWVACTCAEVLAYRVTRGSGQHQSELSLRRHRKDSRTREFNQLTVITIGHQGPLPKDITRLVKLIVLV